MEDGHMQEENLTIELTTTWTANGRKYGKSVFLTKQEVEEMLKQNDTEHESYKAIKKMLCHTVLDMERLYIPPYQGRDSQG